MKMRYTEEEKREALRMYIREAAREVEGHPRQEYIPTAPEFEPAGFQTYWRDVLAEALTKTDALVVLDRWLREVAEETS